MNKVPFKLLLLLLIFVSTQNVQGQTTLDFESGGTGASYTWAVFENVDNPALSIEANPNASGINTSSTVAKFTARSIGQSYAGTESAHGDFGPLTFSASNSIVKIMVYKTVISDVGLKFAETNGEAQPEVKVSNTKINEWEELTYDFSGSIGKGITGILDQIIVFPDFADRAQENIIYFDNISFSSEDGTNPSETALSDLLVDGKSITGFSSTKLDYSYELTEGTTVLPTVTAVITDNTSSVVVTPASGIPGVTTAIVTSAGGTSNTTYSVAFNFEEAVSPATQPIDFEPAGTGASYTWAVFENVDNLALSIEANPNASGINTSSTVAKFTARAAGQAYAGIESAHGDFGPLTFSASNSTVKIMVYKTVISAVGLKFAEQNGEAQPEVKVSNTKINEWEELTFDFSGSIGKGITGILDQIIIFPDFADRSQENIIYFDNISFPGADTGGNEELRLVWSDEFSGNGAINTVNWHHQTQLPNGGSWYNGEEQHYTNRVENSMVSDGYLNIKAKKESFLDQGETKQYTSARLNSKFAFTYGRVDVRAKLPSGDGTWPAIWMLGKNINESGGYWTDEFGSLNWPATGEIDIMEHWGNNPNVIHGSIHTTSSSGGTVNTGTKTITEVSSTFHIYSIIWNANEIQFLIDDVNFYTYNPEIKDANTWPFDDPQYLLLNIAMGGVGGTIDPAFVESSMEIDYVRVYQKESDQEILTEPVAAAPTPTTVPEKVISIFSDAYTDISGTDFDPDWGQGTDATQVMIDGNNTLKYENLNYQGTVIGSSQDVSAMKFLHIDFWTSDATALAVSLISTGPLENKSDLTISKGAWVSVNIPLTNFTVPALNDIIQLKFEGDGTVYLDNIYFTSEEDTTPAETTLSDLMVDGTTINGFSSTNLDYSFELMQGTTVVPIVTAVSTDNTSSVLIIPASEIPGVTKVEVTSATGSSKSTYSVSFKIEDVDVPPTTLPIDFEGEAYGFKNFDGGVGTVIDNPHKNDDNSSSKVAQIVRDGGAMWAGSKLILTTKIDFSGNNAFRMKVYSTRTDVPVLFKLEGPSAAKEISTSTTVANAWETMTWDFTEASSDTYDELVFIFDFGTVGDGSANSTFLFDDIEMYDNTGGLSRIDLPVNFESTAINYTLSDFGGNSTVLGEDPTDATNTVAISTKTSGAETWAGTTVGTEFGFASAVPFTSTEAKINMKVYAPSAGLPIRLKIEDHNDVTLTAETEATTTKANVWEVLTFDFSNVVTDTNPFNVSTNFDKLSIFFNFGVEGTDQVFYWDEVLLGQGAETILGLSEDIEPLVYAHENSLYIKGDERLANSRVAVYNLSGHKVIETFISNNNTVLTINQRGLMIVRISGAKGIFTSKIYIK